METDKAVLGTFQKQVKLNATGLTTATEFTTNNAKQQMKNVTEKLNSKRISKKKRQHENVEEGNVMADLASKKSKTSKSDVEQIDNEGTEDSTSPKQMSDLTPKMMQIIDNIFQLNFSCFSNF